MNTIDTNFFEQLTKQVEGLPNVEAMVLYTTAYIRRYIAQNVADQQGPITVDATIQLARTNNSSGMGNYYSTKTLECIDVHLPPNTVEPPTRGMVRLENIWETEHNFGGDSGHDVYDLRFQNNLPGALQESRNVYLQGQKGFGINIVEPTDEHVKSWVSYLQLLK